VRAGKNEVAADEIVGVGVIDGCGVREFVGFAEDAEVDGWEREISGQRERQAARKDVAVAGFEVNRLGDAFDGKPALAGDHGVALDAKMLAKADGDIAKDGKAPGDAALRFEERKDFGKRIH
jgi:hypothetical protein